MRHLGVIAVSIVNRVCFAFADIRRERFPVVGLLRIVGRAVVFDELAEPRIGAGGVVRRIGQGEDGLVGAEGKALDLAKRRLLQLGGEEL